MVKCKICGKEFTGNGLGGHMSRAHKGKSEKNKKKRYTRDLKSQERQILRRAQEIYREVYQCPEIKNINMNRNKLQRIKSDIVQSGEFTWASAPEY